MSNFYDKMAPYAARAAAALGIDAGVILAQWADESAHGTSALAQAANNFGGINKSENSIAIGTDGDFAKYSSIDQFVDDYIRVMNLSYYDTVRAAGKAGDVIGTIRALGASPYAGSHYDSQGSGKPGQDINDIYYAGNLGQYSSTAPSTAPDASSGLDGNNAKLLAIGAAVLALFAMVRD